MNLRRREERNGLRLAKQPHPHGSLYECVLCEMGPKRYSSLGIRRELGINSYTQLSLVKLCVVLQEQVLRTTAVTLINIDQALFKIVGKWGRYQRNVGAFTVHNPGAMILAKVDCGCSLMVYLEPKFDQTMVVVLQNLGTSIDEDTNSRNRVPH